MPIADLLKECKIVRTRRTGPGGQHRNKVETAVVIEHLPTGIRAEASERRSQHVNHQLAIFRLRVKLALGLRADPEECPSPEWQSRVSGSRIAVSASHDDFPALLAEVLDTLAATDFELPPQAVRFGVTTSQLTKFLKHEPEAWLLVNRGRQSFGLPQYH